MRIVMTVDQPIIFVLDEISLAEPRAEMLRVRRGVTPHQIDVVNT